MLAGEFLGRLAMSRESAVLENDVKLDSHNTPEETTLASSLRSASNASAPAKKPVEAVVPGAKPNFGERIKRLFAKFSRNLEGDHEYHHYRGM
jgi:hypothetical protein